MCWQNGQVKGRISSMMLSIGATPIISRLFLKPNKETKKSVNTVAGYYVDVLHGSFLECSPPTVEARVRFPAGTCLF
jgi:hypothetical protein